jgi:nucleoside phosphorylase
MLHDIFLDFLNRDSREIYGLYRLPREIHLKLLTEAVTAAVFLCRECCILPAGFLAECPLCREVLFERRAEYLPERLLRLSMKEYSLDEFWDKKERQYGPFRDKYRGLFDPRNHGLLRRASSAIVPRSVNIANAILVGWEPGPDANPIWRHHIQESNMKATERIRRIPREILAEGTAVTWPAIIQRIGGAVEASKYRPVLQNVYFSAYILEYGLKVISNLPYTVQPFVVTATNMAYDYESLRAALTTAGVWEIVIALSAPSMIQLRSHAAFIRFREAFDLIAGETDQVFEVRKVFTFAAEQCKPKRRFLSVVQRNSRVVIPVRGLDVPATALDEIADRLDVLGKVAREFAQDTRSVGARTERGRRRRAMPNELPEVAVFVALEMERNFLVDRWGLKARDLEQVWRGSLKSARISVFGRDEMGRVPAAVATMQFLQNNNKPHLLLVAGIAGGLEREQVSLGDVLVATSIVDLASRKMAVGPQFRPKEFATNDWLARYLKTTFDKEKWERSVIKAAEWPDGLRPVIKYGPLASLDEVVANTTFVDNLCGYWPKLLGIEMEAGGVCAAADTFEIAPAVIRCVSDMADPSKSDNQWRRRAMKTLAHLIENIDFTILL